MLRKLCFESILYQDMYPHKRGPLKAVYRYMNNEEYLEMFLKGKIRISTLKACRLYENQEMGDKDEAKEVYKVSYMNDKDPNFHKKANKLNMSIVNSYNITVQNCSREQWLPNGFVLCTTDRRDDEKFSKDFGKFCLRINDSERFFQIISKAIHEKYSLHGGLHEKIIYKPQHYLDDDPPPGKIGFVKRLRYSWQEEYRFLWLPKDWEIPDHLFIDIPEIKYLCERIL